MTQKFAAACIFAGFRAARAVPALAEPMRDRIMPAGPFL